MKFTSFDLVIALRRRTLRTRTLFSWIQNSCSWSCICSSSARRISFSFSPHFSFSSSVSFQLLQLLLNLWPLFFFFLLSLLSFVLLSSFSSFLPPNVCCSALHAYLTSPSLPTFGNFVLWGYLSFPFLSFPFILFHTLLGHGSTYIGLHHLLLPYPIRYHLSCWLALGYGNATLLSLIFHLGSIFYIVP